jgi:hypothetical protein
MFVLCFADIDGNDIVYNNNLHISVAVSSPKVWISPFDSLFFFYSIFISVLKGFASFFLFLLFFSLLLLLLLPLNLIPDHSASHSLSRVLLSLFFAMFNTCRILMLSEPSPTSATRWASIHTCIFLVQLPCSAPLLYMSHAEILDCVHHPLFLGVPPYPLMCSGSNQRARCRRLDRRHLHH